MDFEQESWRKTICIGILVISTWQIFLTFRQITLVASIEHVPELLSRSMNQQDFTMYRNFAVVGLIGKVFEFCRYAIVMCLRIIKGYPAWIWSLTAKFSDYISNRVVSYTILESIMANWIAVCLINAALLVSGNIGGLITFNALVVAILLFSACLTYILVIATKLFGPAALLYVAIPLNVLHMMQILVLIQFILPSFCFRLPEKLEIFLSPTAELVNFPVSNICMIPKGSQGDFGPNAAFIGLWGYKLIIMTESLLNAIGISDSRSVLAHELGHWVKGHMYVTVGSHLVITLASCFTLALCYGNSLVFGVFKFEGYDPPHPAIGVLIGLQYFIPLLRTVLNGFATILGYFCEYQADHFAVDLGLGLSLKNALITLVGSMKRYPIFDSWFAAWFIGHPDVLDRVQRILKDVPS